MEKKNKILPVRFTGEQAERIKKALEKTDDDNYSVLIRNSTMNYVDKILKDTSGNGGWCLIECRDFIKKFVTRAYSKKNYNILKEEKE